VFRGEVTVGGAGPARGPAIGSPRLVILSDGDVVRVHAPTAPARFLLLSAQPLAEPYVRYGPFVMNTEEEIYQAVQELRAGTFIKG
jgi:redox-sensitive bicupin YhaK (pirin superfamily)